jgi:hypothetical protein
MADDKDKHDPEAEPTDSPQERAEAPTDGHDELFTSAEYDFRKMAQSFATGGSAAVVESDVQTPSTQEAPSVSATEQEPSPPWAENDTSAPPAILPPIEKPKASRQRDSGSLEDLVEAEHVKLAGRSEPLKKLGDPSRNLPGKDTQSVVVDMGQLNEDTERKVMEVAAQRAAFSPLESSGAMERITFSNLAAMNFPEQQDASLDSEDDSTVNLHRDQLTVTTQHSEVNPPDVSDCDLQNQIFDPNDPIDRPLRRPGRWPFLILVALVSLGALSLAYAVWNLDSHRDLLLRKPLAAIEMGLGLRDFPLPPAPKAPVVKIQKIAGTLEIENIQLDWAKGNQSAMVSGLIKNASNVAHDRIELSVQLFDEMTNSITVQRSKCCGVAALPPPSKSTNGSADNSMPTEPTPPVEMSRLAPGAEHRFSTKVQIKKPAKGEVTAKVTVHYSEVVD